LDLRSAQSEERKDEHDHDDQTNDINQAVHVSPPCAHAGARAIAAGVQQTSFVTESSALRCFLDEKALFLVAFAYQISSPNGICRYGRQLV
jgi:hypothetical protein